MHQAFNQGTGKLDLVAFENSLKSSGRTLKDYANSLISIGTEGQKAFLNVATAIQKAELPALRTGKIFDQLWITMKNTMRWQITSTALNSFVGTIESAYGYAQDLNESLTNIRIVTENSAEDMAKFAQQANEAAKALSTTTVEYSDAALIYYQQGLTEQEVLDRTETTIKMANAAGISAQTASDQLTAVWNNFYDGSKSLEYYADVMVRLGADTASSSDEISEGIQQFASVADTVGLSYEYAASALATVTATTRESANTVGTAFRTLFARIQGLNLGETLDDGTTLNKYSKALEKVGIDIFDVNGEIKTMDTLLDEMGSKWETLSNDQQIALAQTVAGVRQYTRLIALMDNWDFFQENLASAYGAEGSLQEQADIYAESWEAARDRVKASAEDIYDSVINPDLYINADNVLTPFLSGIADAIDAMGGLNGILASTALLINGIYGNKIAESMRSMVANIKVLSGLEQNRARNLQASAAEIATQLGLTNSMSQAEKNLFNIMVDQANIQGQINSNYDAMDANGRRLIQTEQLKLSILQDQLKTYSQQQIQSRENVLNLRDTIYFNIGIKDGWQEEVKAEINKFNSRNKSNQIQLNIRANSNLDKIYNDVTTQLTSLIQQSTKLDTVYQEFKKLESAGTATRDSLRNLLSSVTGKEHNYAQIEWLTQQLEGLKNQSQDEKLQIRELGTILQTMGADPRVVTSYINELTKLESVTARTTEQEARYQELLAKFPSVITKALIPTRDWATILVQVGSSLSSLTMIMNAFQSIGRIFSDEDMTSTERIVALFTSLGMLLPSIISVYKTLNMLTTAHAVAAAADAAATSVEALATEQLAMAKQKAAMASGILTAAIMVAIIAITAITSAIKAQHEATLAAAQASIDAANAKKEEAQANRELIQSTQNALSTYQETGDGKEELDDLTRQLAEAYDLEGSALARLSGQYEDYNSVLKAAQEAQRRELQETLQSQEEALRANETLILETAREGVGHVYFGGNYEGSFTGFNDFWNGTEEDTASNILLNNVDALYSSWNDNVIGGRRNLAFSIDPNNTEELINFYDQLNNAINLMNNSMTVSERGASGLYNAAVEWRDKMEEVVTQYKETKESINAIRVQLGEFNNQTITDDQVSSLAQYKIWVNEVTEALTSAGYEGEELNDIINDLVSTSLNPDISGFKDIYDAILEVEELVNDEELKSNLESIFTDENYDTSVLNLLNWGALTQETFQDAYDSAKKYTDAISEVENATESLTTAQSALETLGDGDLDREGLESLSKTVDWGNQEKGIIDFNQFLAMTLVEQQSYLQRIINESYQAVNNGLIDQISEAKKRITEQQDILNQYSDSELERAEKVVYAWEQVREAYNDYQGSLNGGEEFNLDNYTIDWDLLGENFDWESFKTETADNVASAFEYGTKEAQDKIDTVTLAEQLISSLQDDIDSSTAQLQINAELNFQNQLDQIENSVDGIVSVFDAISDGVSQTTNEAGEQVWSFSREAAKAIESIYPGFIANAELLRDGTFALTDEMYQAFYNSSQGQLAVDADTKSNMLQNLISLLEAKRGEAEASLKIADQLASGELTINELSDEQKRTLLAGYVNAQNLANGEMLDDQVNSLTAQDTNQQTLWTNVSEYSAQGAQNMSTNVQLNTQNVLANLEKIRDAAYATGIQVSQIGTDNVTKQDFDTSAVSFDSSAATTIDTSNADDFLNSLTANLDVKPVTADDLNIYGDASEALEAKQSQAVGEALRAIYQGSIDGYNEAIAAAKIAQSKLLDSIDGAIEGVKGSSSGGDNEGTKYDEEDEKTLKDIEDRYHEITREIENQNDLLDDIGNNIDRAYGANKLQAYQRELQELEKQQANYNKLLNEAETYLTKDQADLQGLFNNSLIFDENGEIEGYQSVLQSIIDDYNNNFLADYNAFLVTFSNLTKDEQEARQAEYDSWQLQKEAADELFKARQDALAQYEETLDKIQEVKDEQEELERSIADNRLSQIEYKLEVVIEIKDAKDAVRELTKKIAESFGDELTHGIEVARIDENSVNENIKIIKDYEETLKSYQEELANATDATNIDGIISKISDLQGKIISTAEALLDWVEGLEEMLPDALDAASKRFAEFTDQLDHNESILGLIKELYTLQGVTYKTEEGFEQLQKVSEETMKAQIANAQLNKQWYDGIKQELLEAQSALDALDGDETDPAYDGLKANRDALLEEYNEAQQAMLSSAQAAMETAQEMYTQAIERAVYEFGQAVSGGVGLDLLQDKFDHYIEQEDRYLDKVNEAYEVSSWYNKLQQDIDKATNSKMKDQLKQLQEEIDIRRENNTLSEYDLEILEAKYNVLQAQMALEDAQNAKNQLRLVRDSQGNWNYQYTADASQIADAEQNLLDAENEWYNIAKQQVEDVTGEIISTWQECQDKIKEIYSDMTLTDEERSARAQEIYSYYTQKVKDLENEKQIAIQDMTEAGNKALIDMAIVAGDKVSDLTGITSQEIQDIIANSGSSIIDLLLSDNEQIQDIVGSNTKLIDLFDNVFAKDLANMTSNAGNFEDFLSKAMDEASEAMEDYQTTVSGVADQTGTSLDDLKDYIDDVSTSTDLCSDAGSKAVTQMLEQISTIQDLSQEYLDMAESVREYIRALEEAARAAGNTIESAGGIDKDDLPPANSDQSSDNNSSNSNSGPSSGGAGSGNGIPEVGDEVIYTGGTYYHDSYGTDPAGRRGPGKKVKITNIAKGRPYPIHVQSNNSAYGWLKESQISGFDTGGYTGEFDNAKLAFLHEKELVLNQEDTKNILAAVSAIRAFEPSFIASIEKALDGNALSISNLMASRLGSNTQITPADNTVEPYINIERVEFPNATSSDEIQDAIRSLADDATQWANRRKG